MAQRKLPMDRKFIIVARKVKDGSIITETDSVLFLCKDRALIPTLEEYLNQCRLLGCDLNQIEAVKKLIDRVKKYQEENPELLKIPDVDPVLERETLRS